MKHPGMSATPAGLEQREYPADDENRHRDYDYEREWNDEFHARSCSTASAGNTTTFGSPSSVDASVPFFIAGDYPSAMTFVALFSDGTARRRAEVRSKPMFVLLDTFESDVRMSGVVSSHACSPDSRAAEKWYPTGVQGAKRRINEHTPH